MPKHEPLHDPLLDALGSEQREMDTSLDSVEVPALQDEPGLLDAVFAEVDAKPSADSSAEPISLQSRRPAAAWVVPLIAVAAAVVLWFAIRPADAAAPPYQLVSLQAGRADVRGAEASQEIRLSATDAVRLTLAPDGDVSGVVAVAVVARDTSGHGVARRPSQGVEVDASGSVRIDSTLDQLADVSPGPYALEFWIGPADALPEDGAVAPVVNEPSIAVITLSILVPSAA